MNHVYKLVWSRALNALVPVPEVVCGPGRGGRRSSRRSRQGGVGGGLAGLAGALSVLGALSPMVALALPTGGQVTSGQANIQQSGTAVTVTQSSQSAIINWQSFGVAANESVNFRQPGASSVVLNRVLGSDASAIYGKINANGQVFLVNPNGIYFAPGAQVSVGGLVASTLGISDHDFSAGQYNFSGSSTNSVVNAGSITAAKGGAVAFIGPVVDNEGSISTPGGTTALGAGGAVNMTLAGNSLVSFQVSAAALNAAARNGGVIQATGGAVILSAQAKSALLQTVVNNTGVISAQGVASQNGVITLLGGDAGTVQAGGTLDASSASGTGGHVVVTGQNVAVVDGAKILATGAAGGGQINIGGGVHGGGGIAQAVTTKVAATAVLDASATGTGNGGQVSVWSDVTNAASQTQVAGTLLAKGGAAGGNGGLIETSGAVLDTSGITVSAAAPHGTAGQWLLDPTMVEITSNTPASGTSTSGTNPLVISGTNTSYVDPATIDAALNAGTSVTVETSGLTNGGAFDVWVVSPIQQTSGSGGGTLTLQAANSVYVGAPISSTSGVLNVNLYAGNDGGTLTGTGAVLLAANITTDGGNINFGNGGTYTPSGGVASLAGGDVYVNSQLQQDGGGSATNQLVTLDTSSATGGGNVTVNGQTVIANPSGFTINTATSGTGNNGNAYFAGTVDSGNTFQFVSTLGTWNSAYTAAASGTGANVGDTYLATPSTSVLNAVASFTTNYQQAWLGAERLMAPTVTGAPSTATNQSALDNTWYWIAGPLGLVANASSPTGYGTPFFTQTGTTSTNGYSGTAISNAYINWNGYPSGEPNNFLGTNLTPAGAKEYVMQFVGTAGKWNDLSGVQSLAYVKETNLSASPLTVTSGTGTITFGAGVGTNSPLLSLNATGNVIELPQSPTLNTTNGTNVNGQVEVSNGSGGYVATQLLTIAATSQTGTYGSTPPTNLPITYTIQNSTATPTPPTNVSAATETWSVTPTSTSSIGIYEETVSGATWTGTGASAANPYTFIYVNGGLTINPATLYYTATPASSAYGANIASLTGSIAVTGLKNGDTLSGVATGTALFTTTATSASNVGPYSIVGSGVSLTDANYVLAQAPGNSTAYTITPADLYYAASTAASTYGSAIAPVSGTVMGLTNGDTLSSVATGTALFTTTATSTSNAGSYAITGDGLTLTSSNYQLAQSPGNSTAYTITPADLYYTANTASSTYGASIAPLSGSLTGFIGSDTLATTTTGTASFSTTATSASNVGAYGVTGSGLTLIDSNYTLVQASGNSSAYTITPATLYYTANTASSAYGANIAPLTGGITGFIGSDTLATTTTGTASFATTATSASNVGTYGVTGSGLTLNDSNYTLAQGSANGSAYVITPATLTVTGTTIANKLFNGTVSATISGGTLVGVVPNDVVTLSQAAYFASFVPGAQVPVIVNDTLGGANAGNYVLSEPTGLFATILAPMAAPTAVEQTGVPTQTNTSVAIGAINPLSLTSAGLSAVTLGVTQGGVNAIGASEGTTSTVISPYVVQSGDPLLKNGGAS